MSDVSGISKLALGLLVLGGLVALAAPAQAGPITFDFTNNGDLPVANYDVTGFAVDPSPIPYSRDITESSAGAGMQYTKGGLSVWASARTETSSTFDLLSYQDNRGGPGNGRGAWGSAGVPRASIRDRTTTSAPLLPTGASMRS